MLCQLVVAHSRHHLWYTSHFLLTKPATNINSGIHDIHLTDGTRYLRPYRINLGVESLERKRLQSRVWLGQEAYQTGSRSEADHSAVDECLPAASFSDSVSMGSMGCVLEKQVGEIGSPNRAAPEIEWWMFVDEGRWLKWPERTVGKGYVAGAGGGGLMMGVVV